LGIPLAALQVRSPKKMFAPRSEGAAARLKEIGALLTGAIDTLSSQWEASADASLNGDAGAKSRPVTQTEFQASRVIHSAVGALECLVVAPPNFLTNLCMSYSISRALHIAAEHNIAELLSQADDGQSVERLAAEIGLETGKLRESKVL
jgi:hypothetical protein